ncbi:hypothetical protein [Streptomyces sp. NBC_01264]|uniref:hypothetical protein n=1 Tax=Streptomyces sp. NBC_01264 TaxID=2903804 RepID=UPI00225AB809|nr:hypothetical protein [Streptomyces sp. NBC_01264]MCX4783346.1 hypothetical protein [Streptomyces sp. NBC_01264]
MDPRIVIHAPSAEDPHVGRRVHVDGQILGLARNEMDLREFLRRVKLPDWDVVDVTDAGLFRWMGGGPETWEQ